MTIIQRFSPTSGFSLSSLPIRVAPHPRAARAVRLWNTLANKALFVVTSSSPQVTWKDVEGAWSWTIIKPGYTRGPYTSAVVHSGSGTDSRWNAAHELGHVLGLADSTLASQVEGGKYVNPAVCDDPGHPLYSPYDGIMSYCGDESATAFGQDDLYSIKHLLTRQEFKAAYVALAKRQGHW